MKSTLNPFGCRAGLTWPQCRCQRCYVTHTGRALVSHYGGERATQIINGQDQQANADLASWNALGSNRRAA